MPPRDDRRNGEDSKDPCPVLQRRPDMTPERARSWERERHRRRLQTEYIRKAGGFQRLADSEGRVPVRLMWDGFQWIAKTGMQSTVSSDPALMNTTRKLRRLYFGNLPLHLGLTETAFQEIVWEEMKRRNFCNNQNQNPVLCVWFAKDRGNYGFIEMATIEETERALLMDGMECLGVSLKVSRPNDYTSVVASGDPAPTIQENVVGTSDLDKIGSRYVRFVSICTEKDLDSNETWKDVLEDIAEGCQAFGPIRRALIMSPMIKSNAPPTLMAALGDVFFEYETPACAEMCCNKMVGRKYNGRPVQVTKVRPEQFELLDPIFEIAKVNNMSIEDED